jgi:hypothetical protein
MITLTLRYHISTLDTRTFPLSLRCCGRRRASDEFLVEIIVEVLNGIRVFWVVSVI